MTGEFRPSLVKQRYGKCLANFRQADTYNRYPGIAGLDSTGLTATIGRILRSGTMSGKSVEPASLPGAISTGDMAVVKPWQTSQHDLGLLGNLYGGAAAPVQQDSQSVWLWVFDSLQTATDLSTPLSFEIDKTGDLVERYPFTRVKRIEWNFEKGAPVAVTVQLMALGMTYFGPPQLDAGTPDQDMELLGLLSETFEALGTGAARQVNAQITAVAAGPPIVVTVKFAMGGTPSFGSLDQDITTTLSLENFPRRELPLDSNSGVGPGNPLGEQRLPAWAWLLDGTNAAALDQWHWDYGVPTWTPVDASEPEMVTSEVCVLVDDEEVSAPESLTIAVENDYNLVEPGFCGSFSNNFYREGEVMCEIGLNARWLSDRHQKKLLRGSTSEFKVRAQSSTVIDPGNHTQRYFQEWHIPAAQPDDGVALKTFTNGAADSEESIGFRGAPSSTIGGANCRISAYTGFSTL